MAIKINGESVPLGSRFPDDTYFLKIDTNGFISAPCISWYYEDEDEAIALLYVVSHLRSKGFNDISLFLPYLPNARMDRVEEPEDVFTLKYFCDFINGMNFSSVTIFDPHSNVGPALLNRVHVIEPVREVSKVLDSLPGIVPVLFYPDEGAMKRYTKLFKRPYSFGIKHRDWRSGKITSFEIAGQEPVKDRDILVIDDICSRGGTFFHAAKALHEAGAGRIYLYCSHCELTIVTGPLLDTDFVTHIFTTDSICRLSNEKITVFPLEEGKE